MQTTDEPDDPKRRHALGAMAGMAATLAVSARADTHEQAQPNMAKRLRFARKTVLITGATSGIGRAAAFAFAREGGKVAFCGRRAQLGKQVEQQIRAAGGEAMYVQADVRVESDVKRFIEAVVTRYGRLDVAFNNAGITLERPLHEYTLAEWDDVLATNLRGVFLSMKYQIPPMLAAGGGTIVVTSSSNAIATTAKRSAYTASKRALVGLVQASALDYAQKGIRINALVPGTTDTDLIRRAAGMESLPDPLWRIALAQWAKSHVPGLERVATPEEIAEFALVLASDDHPYMTGAALVIDGGKTAHAG